MDRQLAGALIVLLTIVGVAVGSSAAGHRVVGTATAARLPDAPSVGQCVIDDPDRSAGGRPPAPLPAPRFGPCGPTDRGVVVAVDHVTPGRVPAQDPQACRRAALVYAGLEPRGGSFVLPRSPADDPINWNYSIPVRTTRVLPAPSVPSASTWIACVADPPDTGRDTGRLANAFAGGVLPAEFGTCWQSHDIAADMRSVRCDQPHLAELVAVGRLAIDPPIDREQIVSSCARQAATVIRRADPTAGGQLAVRAAPDRSPTIGRPVSVTCYLTSATNRPLVGSLVGLGAGQIRFGD